MAWRWDSNGNRHSKSGGVGASVSTTTGVSIRDSYALGAELGSGTYGRVLKGTRRKDRKEFAVKEIPKFQVRNLQGVRNEVAIMQKLRHPNILRIEEAFDSQRFLHIVIELCNGGEVYEAICARGRLDEQDVVGITLQALAGIRHCHAAHIAHRDLKPQNLLFKQPVAMDRPLGGQLLKIVDFGVSKIFNEHEVLHQVIGSASYMAPEVFQGRYSSKCDIWSVGVILYQMLSGKKPFANRMDTQLNDASFSEPAWKVVSPSCIAFVKRLLTRDERRRPTAAGAMCDPWLKSMAAPASAVAGAPSQARKGALAKPAAPGFEVASTALEALGSYNTERRLQRELIAFLAGQTSPVANSKVLREQFQALDLDGNGFITPAELRHVLEHEGPMSEGDELAWNRQNELRQQQQALARKVQQLIVAADVSGDCRISYHEFLAASMLRSMHLHEEQVALITDDVLLTQRGLERRQRVDGGKRRGESASNGAAGQGRRRGRHVLRDEMQANAVAWQGSSAREGRRTQALYRNRPHSDQSRPLVATPGSKQHLRYQQQQFEPFNEDAPPLPHVLSSEQRQEYNAEQQAQAARVMPLGNHDGTPTWTRASAQTHESSARSAARRVQFSPQVHEIPAIPSPANGGNSGAKADAQETLAAATLAVKVCVFHLSWGSGECRQAYSGSQAL
eukprot:INCI16417.1.p1 GENE.INCI16417.1~~INCI16417.1.p1  ORF type:complete len:677 (-),score=116.79 INCI16417.1:2382-4412(-)